MSTHPCGYCNGTGKRGLRKCVMCQGTGRVNVAGSPKPAPSIPASWLGWLISGCIAIFLVSQGWRFSSFSIGGVGMEPPRPTERTYNPPPIIPTDVPIPIIPTDVPAIPTNWSVQTAYLEVINNSNEAICFLYMSEVSLSDWGSDWLGTNETIEVGQSKGFNMTPGTYNLRALNCNNEVMQESLSDELSGNREWNIRYSAPVLPSAAATSESFDTYGYIYFENQCSSPVKLALSYQDLSDQWRYAYWWNFQPNTSSYLASNGVNLMSNNSYFYYYAEATDNSGYIWKGNKPLIFDGMILETKEIQLSKDSDGDWILTISCN